MKQIDPKLMMGLPVAAAPARPRFVPAVLRISAWCAFMGLAAQVRIPVVGTDVPLTLQSSAVLLAGFALAPSEAVAAMLLYILAGTAGLPVFAPGSAGVLGPTGGYIVGFLPAAWLVSVWSHAGRAPYTRLLVSGAAGTAVIFALGTLWPGRIAFYGGDVAAGVTTGLVPFAAKAVIQLLLAVTTVISIRGLRRKEGRDAAL